MPVVHLPLRARALRALGVLVLLGAGCARGPGPAPTAPSEIAALEAQRAQRPEDPDVNLKLARAYYASQRYGDARAALGAVLRVRPTDGEAQAYLGLVYEEQQHFDSARAVYTRLAGANQSRDVARLIRGRLALLERREMQAAARQALAREAELSRTPPDPNTVAVMPFRYTGRDSTLRPLERGLAALVVTDLSRIGRLRLVERERLQALLDEIQLAGTGQVDPATGARSGRLIGAGQVVQGQFREVPTANFRIDATVVRAGDAGVAASGSSSDQLRQLFDIEKAVVLQLLQRMGITLTPAERAAIEERPTRDVQAFLLYSRGLEARDRGQFGAASQAFQAAVQRDPGFTAAAQQAAASGAAASAVAVAAPVMAASVRGADAAPPGGAQAPAAGEVARGPEATTAPSRPAIEDALHGAVGGVIPSGADRLPTSGTSGGTTTTPTTLPSTDPNRISEATGTDGPSRTGTLGTVTIIIRRP